MKIMAICATLAFFALLLFVNLGGSALMDYDEATYGLVIKETLKSGQIATLKHSISGNWFEKPPLYFWLAMVSQKVFGISEFALRFPSALLGFLAIVLTMLIAYHLTKNKFASAAAGIILATTPIFIEAARQVRLDAPVTAAILFSFFCFLKGRQNPRWFIGVCIGAAIGFMFKSVIGFLIFPIILIWSFFRRDLSWLKSLYFWLGAALALAILIPWHLYESLKFGYGFWNDYLFRHVFRRFSQSIIGTTTQWEYLKFFILLASPWILVFAVGLAKAFAYLKQKDELAKNFLGAAGSAVFIFLIFEFSKTKLLYYLLPMFPFAAISIALLFEDIFRKISKSAQELALAGFFVILALAGTNTIYAAAHKHTQLRINELVANEEKEVGLALAEDKTGIKTYTFEYPYHETIRYYSGGRAFEEIKKDQALSESFFVIMTRQFLNSSPFPPDLAKRLKPVFVGKTVALLKFNWP